MVNTKTEVRSNKLNDPKNIEKAIKFYESDNRFFRVFTFVMAAVSVILTLAMIVYLIVEAVKLPGLDGTFNLFGQEWNVETKVTAPDGTIKTITAFGGLTALVGSLATVLGAMIIGIPLGVFTSVIISRYTKGWFKAILNQLNNLFAGIPSVVWGFFGVAVLVPWFKNNPEGTGQGEGLLASILILALMIIPTIVNISVNSLDAVNKDYVQASMALGNTKNQTTFRMVLPSAKRGIVVASILGVGKALGEGIALSMICGNLNMLPKGFFSSFNTMTTLIFSNFGNAQPVQRQALFLIGVILFAFIVIINWVINVVSRNRNTVSRHPFINNIRRFLKGGSDEREAPVYKTKDLSKKSKDPVSFTGKRNSSFLSNIWFAVSILFTIVTFAVFIYVLVYILANGFPILNQHWGEIFTKDDLMQPNYIGLGSQIITTLIMVGLTLVICVPIGILAAIYLCEYSNPDSPIIKFLRFCIQVLAGAPGILIGLLGYSLFVSTRMFGNSYTILAGVFTLSIMCLPTVINTVENALRSVPKEYIDASTAMGMTKSKTIISIILPQSLTGIFSAIVLTIGKVVAESAALIFTSGTQNLFTNLYSSGASLAVSMYMFVRDGSMMDSAFICGVLIIFLVIIINLVMYFLQLAGNRVANGGKALRYKKHRKSLGSTINEEEEAFEKSLLENENKKVLAPLAKEVVSEEKTEGGEEPSKEEVVNESSIDETVEETNSTEPEVKEETVAEENIVEKAETEEETAEEVGEEKTKPSTEQTVETVQEESIGEKAEEAKEVNKPDSDVSKLVTKCFEIK